MTLENHYLELLNLTKTESIFPFLQQLTDKDKKESVPILKKLSKEYLTFTYYQEGDTYKSKRKATDLQATILNYCQFVCYSLKEFEKADSIRWFFKKENIDPIIDWYCPSWFSDYINNQKSDDFFLPNVNYLWLIELHEKGYYQPDKELIAKLITSCIFEREGKNDLFKPENLTRFELTLKEHIWYVFYYENHIYWSDQYLNFKDKSNEISETGWMKAFKIYSDNGMIDRMRILRECQLATVRNFNNSLSGWFSKLFEYLDPTNQEVLELQDELATALTSVQSKSVNVALKYYKKIATEKGFQADLFIQNSSVLLTSSTKSIVSSSLMVLEKIASKNKERANFICELACEALIHNDESLQDRSSKLIVKYGDTSDESLKQTIGLYHDTLFVSIKKQLADFLRDIEITTHAEEFKIQKISVITDENKIPEISTFDDLLFLTSQAFDGNQSYHFDLLPASLIKFHEEIVNGNVSKLEPVLDRACKFLMQDWSSTRGYLDDMLATYFKDYIEILIQKHPKESKNLAEILNKHKAKDLEEKQKWSYHQLRFYALDQITYRKRGKIYNVFQNILLISLEKIKTKQHTPLLSTPTHLPCWISGVMLVERLSLYQKENKSPDDVDLQLAITRISFEDSEKTIRLAKELLKDELLNLMLFLFSTEQALFNANFYTKAWITASLVKSPRSIDPAIVPFLSNRSTVNLTASYNWKVYEKECFHQVYNYQSKKYISEKYFRKTLEIDIVREKTVEKTGLKKLISKLFSSNQILELDIHDTISFRPEDVSAEQNDAVRLFSLMPNFPDLLCAQIIELALTTNGDSSEASKRLVVKSLQALLNIGTTFGEMSHLFIAASMIYQDKTARSISAEVWIRGVQTQKIDSRLIGFIIGKHEYTEFAPIKRFTDLIIENMYQISPEHNRQLEIMISACLKELSMIPIKNLKKLIELYNELVSLNKSKVDSDLIANQFKEWGKSDTLKKTIDNLIKS